MTYTLYGVPLEVKDVGNSMLMVTEGLQYVTKKDGVSYVLFCINPDKGILVGHEFYSGHTSTLPIEDYEFCERPL